MISFALLTGLYAYGIFFLGVGKLLTSSAILLVTFIYGVSLLFVLSKEKILFFKPHWNWEWESVGILVLLILFGMINFIGALGPEYAFDAVWYHLVLPKLYLLNHTIYHIPGGLFYYSDMPKLGEMLFTAALSFHSEIFANLIQLLFGVTICILLYRFSRYRYSQFLSLLIVLIFYSNIVVSWESTVAYIDLIRTFYEFFSLVLFLQWLDEKNDKQLYLSAIMLGFAITTKLLALGSLLLLSVLVGYVTYINTKSIVVSVKKISIVVLLALIVPLPWFVFSFIHTGNPVYPFFTSTYPAHASLSLLNPLQVISDITSVFTHAADPISPLYLLILPFFAFYRSFRKEMKIVTLYCVGALFVWYITPRTGGGRFMLPYLPAFSLVVGEVLFVFSKKKACIPYRVTLIVLVFILAVSSFTYRAMAVSKYVPYLLGKETKQTFLLNHLNFSFGDFLDVDSQIARQLKPTDVVLLIGFHNLYYVDFPFLDTSFIKKGDRFTYVATQHTTLPKEFTHAKRVYEERKTGVILYYVGERQWGK